MRDDTQHAACVDAWLGRQSQELSSPRLLLLFEGAMRAMWDRTKLTLGDVTLTAIADRVVLTSAEKFPMFASLEVEPNDGIRCQALQQNADALDRSRLREAIRFVLIEFLTVLGTLTADILTPELHGELSKLDTRDTTS